MPRRPRRDEPGAKHHVIARGIARTELFKDDADRERHLRIAERVFVEGGMRVFAWALMPNHVHWVVETGRLPLSRAFQRIHGAYAMGFNRRHDRVGHLFQDRFVSFRVESDEYLVTLVGYVHLNPVRGGLVRLEDLAAHPWTGHGALTGTSARPFHDVAGALALFGDSVAAARDRLPAFMSGCLHRDLPVGPEPLPGWLPTAGRAEFESRAFGVKGLLCRRAQLDEVTRELESRAARRAALRRVGWSIDRVIDLVARRCGAEAGALRRGSHRGTCCRARAIVAHLACGGLGATHAAVAAETGVLPSAITHALRKGEGYARAAGIDPDDVLHL